MTVTYRCQAGLSNPSGFCASLYAPNGYEVKWIEHPPLCVACFRRHIDEIIAAYDRHIQTLQEQINQIKEIRVTEDGVHKLVVMEIRSDEQQMQEEEVRHAQEYAPLLAQQWRLEDELEMTKANKKGAIAKFLETMGVWADG